MKKRLFLAFPLPAAIQNALADTAALLARRLSSHEVVRWVRSEGMHITVHFLGDLEPDAIRAIEAVCAGIVADFRATDVRLDGIKTFPEKAPPRVIAVHVQEDDGMVLRRLQAALGRKLEQVGIDVDHRVWSPHVTIGRVKTRVALQKLAVPVEPLPFRVDALALIESQLTDDGALYTPVRTFPLAP
jgi:2'-5' RNA ligase